MPTDLCAEPGRRASQTCGADTNGAGFRGAPSSIWLQQNQTMSEYQEHTHRIASAGKVNIRLGESLTNLSQIDHLQIISMRHA